jgi:Fe-S-cluster containining protein
MNEPKSRSCGSCFACCIFLGIAELKKYPTQNCKHLDGSLGPNTRCSIYSSRPEPCSRYRCGYIDGIGSDESFRPDNSGVLITPYPDPDKPFPLFHTTIVICDAKKAGTINDGKLSQIIKLILETELCTALNVVNYSTLEVNHFRDGKIYLGRLIKTPEYEGFKFVEENKPFGSYMVLSMEQK